VLREIVQQSWDAKPKRAVAKEEEREEKVVQMEERKADAAEGEKKKRGRTAAKK
jgi:hypothetical protein